MLSSAGGVLASEPLLALSLLFTVSLVSVVSLCACCKCCQKQISQEDIEAYGAGKPVKILKRKKKKGKGNERENLSPPGSPRKVEILQQSPSASRKKPPDPSISPLLNPKSTLNRALPSLPPDAAPESVVVHTKQPDNVSDSYATVDKGTAATNQLYGYAKINKPDDAKSDRSDDPPYSRIPPGRSATYDTIDEDSDVGDALYSKVRPPAVDRHQYEYPRFPGPGGKAPLAGDDDIYTKVDGQSSSASDEPYSTANAKVDRDEAGYALVIERPERPTDTGAGSAMDQLYTKVVRRPSLDTDRSTGYSVVDKPSSSQPRPHSTAVDTFPSPPPAPPLPERPPEINAQTGHSADAVREPSYRYITVRESLDTLRTRMAEQQARQNQPQRPVSENNAHYYSTISEHGYEVVVGPGTPQHHLYEDVNIVRDDIDADGYHYVTRPSNQRSEENVTLVQVGVTPVRPQSEVIGRPTLGRVPDPDRDAPAPPTSPIPDHSPSSLSASPAPTGLSAPRFPPLAQSTPNWSLDRGPGTYQDLSLSTAKSFEDDSNVYDMASPDISGVDWSKSSGYDSRQDDVGLKTFAERSPGKGPTWPGATTNIEIHSKGMYNDSPSKGKGSCVVIPHSDSTQALLSSDDDSSAADLPGAQFGKQPAQQGNKLTNGDDRRISQEATKRYDRLPAATNDQSQQQWRGSAIRAGSQSNTRPLGQHQEAPDNIHKERPGQESTENSESEDRFNGYDDVRNAASSDRQGSGIEGRSRQDIPKRAETDRERFFTQQSDTGGKPGYESRLDSGHAGVPSGAPAKPPSQDVGKDRYENIDSQKMADRKDSPFTNGQNFGAKDSRPAAASSNILIRSQQDSSGLPHSVQDRLRNTQAQSDRISQLDEPGRSKGTMAGYGQPELGNGDREGLRQTEIHRADGLDSSQKLKHQLKVDFDPAKHDHDHDEDRSADRSSSKDTAPDQSIYDKPRHGDISRHHDDPSDGVRSGHTKPGPRDAAKPPHQSTSISRAREGQYHQGDRLDQGKGKLADVDQSQMDHGQAIPGQWPPPSDQTTSSQQKASNVPGGLPSNAGPDSSQLPSSQSAQRPPEKYSAMSDRQDNIDQHRHGARDRVSDGPGKQSSVPVDVDQNTTGIRTHQPADHKDPARSGQRQNSADNQWQDASDQLSGGQGKESSVAIGVDQDTTRSRTDQPADHKDRATSGQRQNSADKQWQDASDQLSGGQGKESSVAIGVDQDTTRSRTDQPADHKDRATSGQRQNSADKQWQDASDQLSGGQGKGSSVAIGVDQDTTRSRTDQPADHKDRATSSQRQNSADKQWQDASDQLSGGQGKGSSVAIGVDQDTTRSRTDQPADHKNPATSGQRQTSAAKQWEDASDQLSGGQGKGSSSSVPTSTGNWQDSAEGYPKQQATSKDSSVSGQRTGISQSDELQGRQSLPEAKSTVKSRILAKPSSKTDQPSDEWQGPSVRAGGQWEGPSVRGGSAKPDATTEQTGQGQPGVHKSPGSEQSAYLTPSASLKGSSKLDDNQAAAASDKSETDSQEFMDASDGTRITDTPAVKSSELFKRQLDFRQNVPERPHGDSLIARLPESQDLTPSAERTTPYGSSHDLSTPESKRTPRVHGHDASSSDLASRASPSPRFSQSPARTHASGDRLKSILYRLDDTEDDVVTEDRYKYMPQRRRQPRRDRSDSPVISPTKRPKFSTKPEPFSSSALAMGGGGGGGGGGDYSPFKSSVKQIQDKDSGAGDEEGTTCFCHGTDCAALREAVLNENLLILESCESRKSSTSS